MKRVLLVLVLLASGGTASSQVSQAMPESSARGAAPAATLETDLPALLESDNEKIVLRLPGMV